MKKFQSRAFQPKRFEPLKSKTLALLLQLPPSMTMKEGLNKTETFPFANGYRYAVEVRHKSWFEQSVYDLFSKLDLCLVWNQLDAIVAPPERTTDFAYICFIGDRSIDEKDFGRIQKDRIFEMEKCGKAVRRLKMNDKTAIVAANNHYAGFGPATASEFRKLVGLEPAVWEEMKQKRPTSRPHSKGGTMNSRLIVADVSVRCIWDTGLPAIKWTDFISFGLYGVIIRKNVRKIGASLPSAVGLNARHQRLLRFWL